MTEQQTINIFGACVSRDIFPKDSPYVIQQFVSFTNPMSLYVKHKKQCSYKDKIATGDLDNLTWGTQFKKRCLTLDSCGESLNYLFQKESEWLLLDLADFRMDLVSFSDNYFTKSNLFIKNRDSFDELIYTKAENGSLLHPVFKRETGSSIEDSLYSFSLQEYYSCLEWFLKKITDVYETSKIILHEYYLANQYITRSGDIKSFEHNQLVTERNWLLTKLYERCKELLKGCKVIKMPDYILSDEMHRWGCHPLHYCSVYYEYAYKALNMIIDNNGDLDELRLNYSTISREKYINTLHESEKAKIKKLNIQLKKADVYNNCFLKIIKNKELVLSNIKELAERNNIKTMAFWGDYLTSKALALLVNECGITLKYIVSNWNDGTASEVIPTNADHYPTVDAFVICDVMNVEKRSIYCRTKTKSPIYSVFAFLPK